MKYSEFAEVYEKLAGTSKRLEKVEILAEFLKKLQKDGEKEWIYLLRGRVLADYDSGEFGISTQLAIKSISVSFGIALQEVTAEFKKKGDLGNVAEYYAEKRKQSTLFQKRLEVRKVFDNLRALIKIEGKGAIERKIALISELLTSASGKEAKYIIRTLLSDLRVGVADSILIDALNAAFFSGDKEIRKKIEEMQDLANDFALVFEAATKGKEQLGIAIVPGKPIKVMLAVKVDKLEEAFEICGKPAALEYKYDGFRLLINKNKEGKISLFTRRLENVTNQFPDIVGAVKKNIKGRDFIFDSEIAGYEPKTKRYVPFQAISQRIKRKYEIDKLVRELPVEINIFDVVYYNGKNLMNLAFKERRKLLEKVVRNEPFKIRVAKQLVTDDEKKADEFYKEALKIGEEGIMIKKLDAPYRTGRRVGYMVKLKPVVNEFDLVIVGAEYGTGKRAGWLTSYIVACRSGKEFLEVGMVSSGLKEKAEEGMTYDEMTKILRPLVIEEVGNKVKIEPRVVVSVTYQNIQKSPTYSSGYALRFPRIAQYRPDRSTSDIASLQEIEREVKKMRR